MAASGYVKELRDCVGHRLLLLPGVAAVVRDAEGRILIQQRRDHGTWGIPGGAVDPGETPAAAVVRETREETGIEVVAERIVAVVGGLGNRLAYPNGDVTEYVTVVFDCRAVGGALRPEPDESLALRFVPEAELPPLTAGWELPAIRHPAGAPPFFDPPGARERHIADPADRDG